MAVDLMTRDVLAEASKRAGNVYEREHVVPYLAGHPELFPTQCVSAPASLRRPGFDLSVDYPEDLERLQRIYRYFGRAGGPETTTDLIAYLDAHPELARRATSREAK